MNKKTITSAVALFIIPILYFIVWSGFEIGETNSLQTAISPEYNHQIDFISIIDTNQKGKDKFTYSKDADDIALKNLIESSVNSKTNAAGKSRILESLCEGKRFDFEAGGNPGEFSFSQSEAMAETDGSREVIHACPNVVKCPQGNAMPRIICSNIFDNLSDREISGDYFRGSEDVNWYLKPMVRIKQTDFDLSDERPVIGIIVKGFDRKPEDTIVIRVRNFADERTGMYDGSYKNKFTFLALADSLRIPGMKTKNNQKANGNINGKVDFEIFWFGQVEVWFDKLTVDDDMGNQLFNSENAISSGMDELIKSETTKESFCGIIYTLSKEKHINVYNYQSINYVLNKMYEHLYPVSYAQAR